MEWYKLSDSRKMAVLEEVALQQRLPTQAVEKDWWVTQCLRAIYVSRVAQHIIFKGGTSLSKGWDLIERFSEDIDLSIAREFLGFSGELSSSQIKKLRKRSCEFVAQELSVIVREGLLSFGAFDFEIEVPASPNSDTDPQVIFVCYPTLVPLLDYVPAKVKIEVGARALMEPIEPRPIRSMVGSTFPDASFSDVPFLVPTVLPKRTFLEKVFLLHELLASDPEKIGARMTRHLYDLERMMDTDHGKEAVADIALFRQLASFRKHYNTIKNVDYDRHRHENISIVPHQQHLKAWADDYSTFTKNMIHGDALSFEELLIRMKLLEQRFLEVGKGI